MKSGKFVEKSWVSGGFSNLILKNELLVMKIWLHIEGSASFSSVYRMFD